MSSRPICSAPASPLLLARAMSLISANAMFPLVVDVLNDMSSDLGEPMVPVVVYDRDVGLGDPMLLFESDRPEFVLTAEDDVLLSEAEARWAREK